MKKNYFLLLVTMLLGFISLGQTVSIGTPGTTTNQAIPIEPYYGYSWGQSIYPASELTTAGMIGVRQIDTITFEYTSATLNNSTAWVVYLANSTKSTFSSGTNWEPLSSFTEVFNGTATVTVVSGGNNLVKIALSTPYYWDGTSNLIVGAARNWCKTVLEWNLASNSKLEPHTPGGCTECLGAITIDGNNVTKNSAYYIIAHASKLVRPGSKRISSTNSTDLPNVAFKTPNNEIVVIIANNTSIDKSFNINVLDEPVTTSLKAGSVGTYVWKL